MKTPEFVKNAGTKLLIAGLVVFGGVMQEKHNRENHKKKDLENSATTKTATPATTIVNASLQDSAITTKTAKAIQR